MADVSWDQVKDFLSNLTIKELSDKVKELEEDWGVKAASGGGMMMAAPTDGPAAVEEQTEFDAVLTGAGPKKIQVIKAVRELTGLGLKEAKAVVDGAPAPIKEGVSKEDAEAVKEKIEAAGGSVEIK